MLELAKPVALYALTGVTTWLASRYHLSGDQTAAVTADVVAGAAMVGGVATHWLAYIAPPPKGTGK